jgi:hypothetical protein
LVIRVALAIIALAMIGAAPALARDSLGVFEDWAAFRDPETPRCYAIAEPDSASSGGFYASIGFWPNDRVRGQMFVRFPRALSTERPVALRVGGRSFALVVRGRGAWARDARMDAVIVAALRSATRMEVSGRSADGTLMTGGWRLRGAATAIDAAALGCARR